MLTKRCRRSQPETTTQKTVLRGFSSLFLTPFPFFLCLKQNTASYQKRMAPNNNLRAMILASPLFPCFCCSVKKSVFWQLPLKCFIVREKSPSPQVWPKWVLVECWSKIIRKQPFGRFGSSLRILYAMNKYYIQCSQWVDLYPCEVLSIDECFCSLTGNQGVLGSNTGASILKVVVRNPL